MHTITWANGKVETYKRKDIAQRILVNAGFRCMTGYDDRSEDWRSYYGVWAILRKA